MGRTPKEEPRLVASVDPLSQRFGISRLKMSPDFADTGMSAGLTPHRPTCVPLWGSNNIVEKAG
jgi:hypothetical protein